MKKITLILISLFNSFLIMAQQNPQSEVAEITLPKEANKMNKEQTLDFVHKHFKHLKILNNYNNTYYIENISITIRDQQLQPDQQITLESHKQETEAFDRRYGGNIIDSKIVILNNIRFLIFEVEFNNERDLAFTSDFKNGKMVYCSLKYKKEDEDKAQAVFKKIINTVRYKN